MKNLQQNSSDLVLRLYAAGNFTTRLYEDAGDNNDYRKNAFTFTTIQSTTEPDGTVRIEVLPAEGSFPEMIKKRNLDVQLCGSVIPESVSINGKEVKSGEATEDSWNYSGDELVLHGTHPGSRL